MAEAVTQASPRKPLPKRRRILDPASVVPVSVYSNQVSSGLQLKLTAAEFSGSAAADGGAGDGWWRRLSAGGRAPSLSRSSPVLSDSEDEAADTGTRTEADADGRPTPSPSPSLPTSPVQKHSRQVRRKLGEVDRVLRSVSSFLSPPTEAGTTSRPPGDQDPEAGPGGRPCSPPLRDFPLKVRCRADLLKIPVLAATPLSAVLARLSVTLGVPPQRLLLLREEAELRVDATVGQLGLGIADIIECVVMAAEERREVIGVRLQSRDRKTAQEFRLHRDAPLGSVFSQYLSRLRSSASHTVRFYFDGSRVEHSQTPAELDMEDGDMVEVWLCDQAGESVGAETNASLCEFE